MKTDETQIGIVVESYAYGENQVVIARSPDTKIYHFFYLPSHPDINFGDTLIMIFNIERFYLSRGNPHLTYRLFPLVFPGTLLWELIFDRMNEDSK